MCVYMFVQLPTHFCLDEAKNSATIHGSSHDLY